MTMFKGPRCVLRIVMVPIVFLFLAAIGASVPAADALLSDCTSACGGTPSNFECTAMCQLNNCPGPWVWGPPDTSVQACTYSTSFQAGTQGAWIVSTSEDGVCDCCASTTCGGLTINKSFAEQATATVSLEMSLEVQASVNVEIVGVTAGIKVTEQFKAGQTNSSSKTVTIEHTGNLNPGGCGKKKGYLTMFKASRPASGIAVFQFSGVCVGCENPTHTWINFKAGQVNVTLAGSDRAGKWTECDLLCTNVPNEACQTSATQDANPCEWDKYP